MVFLLTPDGEYRQLPCPGEVTIGRTDDNNIVVKHKSVSSSHCKITLEQVTGIKNKIQILLEDPKSLNGTYAGPSPLEIEKVVGRQVIHVGWYLRIGHLNKYFQILEHVPLDQDLVLPELTILPINSQGQGGTRTLLGSNVDLVLPEAKSPRTLQRTTAATKEASLNIPTESNNVYFTDNLKEVAAGGDDVILQKAVNPADNPPSKSDTNSSQKPLSDSKARNASLKPRSNMYNKHKLPVFRAYDKLKEGSLLKYLDLLDQWKDQLHSITEHILQDNIDLEQYLKAIMAKAFKPISKAKKNRFQSRYLYLAQPKAVEKETADQSKGKLGDTAREALLAELVAESMAKAMGAGETTYDQIEGLLGGLHELLQHCYLGGQIGPNTIHDISPESKELDYLLQNELLTVLQNAIHSAQALQQSPLLSSIQQYYRKKDTPCDVVVILEETMTTMQRIAAFIVKSDDVVNDQFSIGEYYEVVLICLGLVVEEVYDVYTVLLTLLTEAEQASVTHTHTHRSSKLKNNTKLMDSYNEEVDEMRQMKYDADLLSLLERVREQEAGLISEKFKRIVRVLEIFTRQNLYQSFRQWKYAAKDIKRKDLKKFDFIEKINNKVKRKQWAVWRQAFKKKKNLAKCLFRLTRAVGYNLEKVRRCYWEIWKRNISQSPRWARSSDSLAQLKLSVLQLQAQLQEQANQDQNIAALAAEKALNRELTATNNELRGSIQSLQLQLMEMCNISLAKRRDVVLHSLLDKEEEVARSRKELKLLRAEVEQLRNIMQQQHDKIPRSHYQEEGEDEQKTPRTIRRQPAPPNSKGVVSEEQWRAMNSNNAYGYQEQSKHSPYNTDRKVPVSKMGAVMSRQEAVQIVLMEVRRLKDSMKRLQAQSDELKAIAADEMEKRVDQVNASQQMTYRLIDLERSATALRELLKQRVGLNVYTELVTSLESMGVGAHALQTSAQHTVRDPELVTNVVKQYKPNAKKTKDSSLRYERSIEDAFS